jgi:flagellar biosynthesis protein FliQ
MAIGCWQFSEKFWGIGDVFMTDELVLMIGAEAIKTVMYIAGPMLLAAMVVGVAISVMQAITQINEATLTFIPKIFAVVLVLVVMAPWMLKIIQEYAVLVIGSSGDWIR